MSVSCVRPCHRRCERVRPSQNSSMENLSFGSSPSTWDGSTAPQQSVHRVRDPNVIVETVETVDFAPSAPTSRDFAPDSHKAERSDLFHNNLQLATARHHEPTVKIWNVVIMDPTERRRIRRRANQTLLHCHAVSSRHAGVSCRICPHCSTHACARSFGC